ncbi:NACHT domain-containing protein [Fusarium sp. Ph1]|nr:NACHT domain-containing protein [Fusarium sp. Ph1]
MTPKWLQVLRPKRGRSPSPAGGTRQDTPPHPVPSQSGSSVSTPAPIIPEPQMSPAVMASKDPIRTRIWNSAYDKAKEDEPRLVEAYEKILSACLGDADPAPLDGGSTNVIKQDADARQDQMRQLVEKGLEKIERGAKAKEKVKEGMQPIKNVKDLVASAVKSEPSAAVAWVGITTFMEVSISFSHGADESTTKLQELLEKHIVSLYKKLLVYQMKSVYLYNKHWAAVFARDLVKIDDWQDKVDSIKKAEEAIREKIRQKNSELLKSRLARIDGKLGHLRLDIQAVTSAVGGVESAVNKQTRGLLKIHYDEKDSECLKDLHIVNPQTHKKQLEKTKGGLLKDSYRWILDNDDFRGFRGDPGRRLLWIKGDPGKGKTMLLCGIIDELEKESTNPLSYFFCQATQDNLRSVISVLRGLVWLLCKKHSELMPCVRAVYDMEGKICFSDLFSLKGILGSMLQKPCLQSAVLIVDALDECSYQTHDVVEREELIDLIIELSEYKTDELAHNKLYDEETKEAVLQRLLAGANDTFLWVALICKELARPVVRPRETLTKLYHLPIGLEDLHIRMLEQIVTSEYSSFCLQILAFACIAYRPLSLDELQVLMPDLHGYGPEELRDLIGECGSFLTLQGDVIYFVHQSAQDFLIDGGKDEIFPSGIHEQHRVLFRRSLEAPTVLKRDLYGLKSPGVFVEDITSPDPDPLSPLRYASLYWIDHFENTNKSRNMSDYKAIEEFLREKYLYWLETLSLQRVLEQGPGKLQRLKNIACDSKVKDLDYLVEDARRFVFSYWQVISEAPLQLYASALVFSPTSSLIRQLFRHEEPSWLARKPRPEPSWSDCILKFRRSKVSFGFNRVAISPDRKLLSRLHRDTVEISNLGWIHSTHSTKVNDWATRVQFAPNGEQLAVGSGRGVVELLDAKSGQPIQQLMGHEDDIEVLTFSPDGKLLASASSEEIMLWNLGTGRRLQIFDCSGHSEDLGLELENLYTQTFEQNNFVFSRISSRRESLRTLLDISQ